MSHEPQIREGDPCEVVGGTHRGKVGTAADINTSKSDAVTITVVEADGTRFKTLAKNVTIASG